MKFTSDDPRINRQGKKPGTENKFTKEIKEAFGLLLQGNLDNLTLWLEQVAERDPKAALEIVMKMSERFLPRLSQQALTDADGGDLFKNIKFEFGPPIDSPLRIQDETNPEDNI